MTDMIKVVIDGIETEVEKGTLIIRAAETIGIEVPRFCDHPLLDPIGACRQCIVEVEGQRKPVASCTVECTDGMIIKTHLTSAVAEKAQRGTMELLLANHPLDCPVCDKGGECPLQNQAMSHGNAESRFHEPKRTYEKPVPISSEILLDRERCVLCARCTRFSDQIAGDNFIELYERGALEQISIDPSEPFHSYFSGNTVQICPVGALTGAAYRFTSRPFDLVSTDSTCEHCSAGCAIRVDHRKGVVTRRQAANDPEVNEEWSCDKGRWAFHQATRSDRLTTPLVRGADGTLVAGSWTGALQRAGQLIGASGSAAVLAGGRLTLEDAYALGKLARGVLGTNDVDFRARAHSVEEEAFLGHLVAGRTDGVTYTDLENAKVVVLVGFDVEEISPILFLRLRKAVRQHGLKVVAIAPHLTRGLTKLKATLIATRPGDEASALLACADAKAEGAILLVGDAVTTSAGTLSVASSLAADGVRGAWVPRRAGDRGALDAGLLPTLLPGGRPVADDTARAEVETAWGMPVPTAPGRSFSEILAACAAGEIDCLITAGIDIDDLPDPAAARAALDKVKTLIVLEIRATPLAALADVVLSVAPAQERDGTYVNWEGRHRAVTKVISTNAISDLRVTHLLAAELGVDLGLPDAAHARKELADLGRWGGERVAAPDVAATPVDGTVLATWTQLLDDGTLSDGEPHLAGTRKAVVARMTAATAAGAPAVTVTGPHGSVTLPVEIAEGADGVVWIPTRGHDAGGVAVNTNHLGLVHGSSITLAPAELTPVHDGTVPAASEPEPTPPHAVTSAEDQAAESNVDAGSGSYGDLTVEEQS